MFEHENHVKSFFIMLVPFVIVVALIYYANKKHMEWLSTNMQDCPGCNETPVQQEQMMAHMPLYVDDAGNRPFPFMQHQGLTIDQIRRGM